VISTADEFFRLRNSPDPAEYQRASQDEAPEQVWLEVIARFPALRQWVAHNKTVPISILERLSDDSSTEVRCAVAEKRKLTQALRQKLALDIDSSVRHRVACNAKCESMVLELLANDREPFVREAAIKQLQDKTRAPYPTVERTCAKSRAGRSNE
jgi:hypothetical protein